MLYFAVSDIHGCFYEMNKALDQAGFDKNNKNHKLIVIGDAFDRGPKNLELADYLVEMYNAGQLIYVLGNHDLFLMDYVAGNVTDAIWNAQRNGMKYTVEQLSGIHKMESWYSWLMSARKKVGQHPIFQILLEAPLWFENDKFIYAHSGIPNFSEWREIMEMKDTGMRTDLVFKEDYKETLGGKKLIVGHWHAFRLLSDQRGYAVNHDLEENHRIFESEDGQKIGIDGCTNYSGIVNVHIYDEGGE